VLCARLRKLRDTWASERLTLYLVPKLPFGNEKRGQAKKKKKANAKTAAGVEALPHDLGRRLETVIEVARPTVLR